MRKSLKLISKEEFRVRVARELYNDWNPSKGISWKDLPDYRQNVYLEWVDIEIIVYLPKEIWK